MNLVYKIQSKKQQILSFSVRMLTKKGQQHYLQPGTHTHTHTSSLSCYMHLLLHASAHSLSLYFLGLHALMWVNTIFSHMSHKKINKRKSEEKGKKTSSRKQNMSLRLRPAACVLLSLLAFLSQQHLFKKKKR